MTSLLLQFVFIVLLVILPMALYRSRRSFMAVFYRAMTDNAQARKFYTQVLVVLLLLFHYVYTTGHPGQFGTVLSAIVCAAMFSARRTDRWLRKLLDRPKSFVACGVFALAVCIVPQLFTLSATVSYILLAALFYPSVRVMTEFQDIGIISEWMKFPRLLAESYYDHHHAILPQDADSGNTDISAQ